MLWDVDIFRQFENPRGSFALEVHFQSDAKRLVLFGPSGAGKTQTLKMIAGLVSPERGHIRLNGMPVFDHSAGVDLLPQRRAIGYVFQDYALFPHLTVLQNMTFALHTGLFNPKRDAQPEPVRRWLDAFHLESLAHQYPEQLSGGQRQRVALARSLVAAPRALLLDEPFAALDRTLRTRLRKELMDLQAELELPMILITHDEEDVEVFAQAVIRLEDGSVVRDAAHDKQEDA